MKRIGIILATFLIFMSAFAKDGKDRGYIVKVGDMAPNFSMKTPDGQAVKLSDLKGKIVMLQFTASWCGVCRKEMPFIEKEIWNEHKNKDFALYGIDLKETPEKVKEFTAQTKVTYPLMLDPDGEIFGLFAEKNAGVTRNVIIDRNGKIVYLTRLFNREEFDEMKNKINELLEAK